MTDNATTLRILRYEDAPEPVVGYGAGDCETQTIAELAVCRYRADIDIILIRGKNGLVHRDVIVCLDPPDDPDTALHLADVDDLLTLLGACREIIADQEVPA